MRESIGASWLYGLVITFIMLFSAFLLLALNYSEAFDNRNEVINILEKYEGYNPNAITVINEYLNAKGYDDDGNCPEGSLGATIDGDRYTTDLNGKYNYCLTEIRSTDYESYYEVSLFFKFDLPFLGDILTYPIRGETEDIIVYNSVIR